MNSPSLSPAPRPLIRRFWFWALLAVPLMFVLLVLMLGAGVVGCFGLSSDARVLRDEVIQSSGVDWQQKIAVNAGRIVTFLARTGLSCAPLDPGARAALRSVQAAGVGVYELPEGTPPPNRAAMLAAADSALTARGWQRVVGVLDGPDLVTVYVANKVSAHHLKCCVLVFDGRELVLVTAQANPEPLVKFALAQPGLAAQAPWLARR